MNQTSVLDRPEQFRRKIIRSDEFIAAKSNSEIPEGRRLHLGIRLGAQALSKTYERTNKKESLVYHLISCINTFAEAQHALDQSRARPSTRRERIPHLAKVIEFNHAVKDLVNYDQNISFNDLLTFITEEYIGSNRDSVHKLQWFESAVSASLNGMRHELAYERIIGAICAGDKNLPIDYADTTTEDELSGIDYHITYGDDEFGIDVKSTQRACQEAQLKSSDPAMIVWSHVNWEDFEGGFHISPEIARSRASVVLQDLKAAKLAA